jgi:hypothetical protein
MNLENRYNSTIPRLTRFLNDSRYFSENYSMLTLKDTSKIYSSNVKTVNDSKGASNVSNVEVKTSLLKITSAFGDVSFSNAIQDKPSYVASSTGTNTKQEKKEINLGGLKRRRLGMNIAKKEFKWTSSCNEMLILAALHVCSDECVIFDIVSNLGNFNMLEDDSAINLRYTRVSTQTITFSEDK